MNCNLFKSSLWNISFWIFKLAQETQYQISPKVNLNNIIKYDMKRIGRLRKRDVIHGRKAWVTNQQQYPDVKEGFISIVTANNQHVFTISFYFRLWFGLIFMNNYWFSFILFIFYLFIKLIFFTSSGSIQAS